MPILRRFSKAKLNDDQVKTMGAVLDRYTEFCHLPKEENERHPMNQSILINHEVLALVFDILSSEIDAKLMEQYRGLEEILKKSLKLLKALAMGNDVVQMRMFERLDELLRIKVVESDIAIALKETFIGNQLTCLKILPSQIQAIVDLAAEHQEKAPEFLDLLNVIVKVEGLGLTLKRNQAYVMKYIMQDYNKLAYVLDQPRELKERILTMQSGKDHLKYLINLIDLLATCAEGENRFIESMCQTIMSVEELMWVINHPEIDNNLKKPFLRYFLWVYMKTAGSAVESGAGDLPHDAQLWRFMKQAAKDACELTEFISRNQETASNLLKKPPAKTDSADPGNVESAVHCNLHYFFDTVIPILQAFYTKFYIPDKDLYPQEVENTDKLSRALVGFCEAAIPLLMNPAHLKTVISCITAIIPSSTVPNSVMEGLIEQLRNSNRLRESRHQVTKGHKEYYQGELELNAKLRIFAVNCSLLYGGHNTVQAQLKTKSKRTYTEIGGDEELPLGEEFQEHLRRFIKPGEKKVKKRIELCLKLVNQLGISSLMYRKLTLTEAARIEQEELDIRCLQLLRATIHNEERKLPEDWEEHPSEHRKQMKMIKELQIELNEMGAVIKALPHLARPSDRIAKEVLAFVCIMLFNANNDVQSSLLYYFLHTREESFFAAIRERMHLSALAIKERRSLAAQQRARAKEVVAQSKSMHSTMAIGKKALQEIQAIDNAMKRNKFGQGRKVSLSTLQSKAARRRDDQKKGKSTKQKPPKETKVNGYANERCKDSQTLINNEQFEMDTIDLANETSVEPVSGTTGVMGEEEMEEIDQKDDGYIELVLRVLARMCDGQHRGLQDYLREQPDNMKSFNIVAETAQFVNLVYSNVNAQNIVLATQLFETLNEFTVGNQSNRSVMLNSKVIDYINFILRAAEFSDCDQHKVLELKQSIGNIVISMVEENSPESLQVAKEVKDTLDKEAIYRCLTACYETTQPDRAKYNANPLLAEEEPKGPLNIGVTLQSARNLAKLGTQMLKSKQQDVKVDPETKEMLDEVGFTFYLILARVYDLDPKLVKTEVNITSQQMEAFNHYRKNTMSIEILKEDHLQKINFRVKNKNVLREEVKEKLIWSVDRSSPSNKIRDLMKWSKDILKDIYYQRKILSNPLATFFTKNWPFWNKVVILLSLIINIFMLFTWNATWSIGQADPPGFNASTIEGVDQLPKDIKDPLPNVTLAEYDVIIYGLGGAHNFFSFLVLLTYFLSNHPTLPSLSGFRKKIRSLCSHQLEKDEEDDEKDHISKLEVKFLSFTTVYYMVFLGMSIAGTIFQGYFYAFHLLNIVNNNQLLKGVIQAVTQNGKSLLWVAVLGLVVFYIYALISFALLRSSFDPDDGLYCATLWQCTITVIRYGLTAEIFDSIQTHPAENTFLKFGLLVVFHLSFFIFITTIGLNIIFGIIVDTFSELRDLKWTAERDMRDTCFICSRGSYDFEHHGTGFEHHINQEHHIWAYIFFFIHLHDTKCSDYTALELFVFKLLSQEKYDFFPLNRALSLSLMDEDSTESKVDDLLHFVMQLVDRQREEDAKKKREDEKLKQLRWKELHRSALGPAHRMDSVDTADSSNGPGALPGFHDPSSQINRQKRWKRTTKLAGVLQGLSNLGGVGIGTIQPPVPSANRFAVADSLSGDDLLEGSPSLPHDQSTTETIPLEQRHSPSPSQSDRPPYTPKNGIDDSVHLIDFEEEDEDRDDMSPSPPPPPHPMGSMFSGSDMSLPRHQSPSPPPSLPIRGGHIQDRDARSSSSLSDKPPLPLPSPPASQYSSRHSVPTDRSSIETGTQVGDGLGSDTEGAIQTSSPRLVVPSDSETAMSDSSSLRGAAAAPPLPSRPGASSRHRRSRDPDLDGSDPDDLKSTRV